MTGCWGGLIVAFWLLKVAYKKEVERGLQMDKSEGVMVLNNKRRDVGQMSGRNSLL